MNATQPLRVMIVDDEAPARSRLADLLSDCALKIPIVIVGQAEVGPTALLACVDQACLFENGHVTRDGGSG